MAMSLRNINAHFRDSPVDTALRNQTQGGPAGDKIAETRDQTRERKMRGVPRSPRRRLRLKCRIAGGEAFKIDRPYLFPIGRTHLSNHRGAGHIRLDRYI